uniref:Uncharacterized protein n=1 Tax=Panagrellus redivivus TaxID=6233 RepID=A0A7E4WCD8_PANRE
MCSESEDVQIFHHRRARSDEIPVYKRNSISLGVAMIMDQHNRHDSTASFNIATFFDKVPFRRLRCSNALETRIDEETPCAGSSEFDQSTVSPLILLGDMKSPPRRGTDNSTNNDNLRKLSTPEKTITMAVHASHATLIPPIRHPLILRLLQCQNIRWQS